jgi:hypothetical protein
MFLERIEGSHGKRHNKITSPIGDSNRLKPDCRVTGVTSDSSHTKRLKEIKRTSCNYRPPRVPKITKKLQYACAVTQYMKRNQNVFRACSLHIYFLLSSRSLSPPPYFHSCLFLTSLFIIVCCCYYYYYYYCRTSECLLRASIWERVLYF